MRRRTVFDALRAAAAIHGIRVRDIVSKKNRNGHIFDVRAAVCLVARDHLNKSHDITAIALERHNTTIISMIDAHRDRPKVQAMAAEIITYMKRPTLVEREHSAERGVNA